MNIRLPYAHLLLCGRVSLGYVNGRRDIFVALGQEYEDSFNEWL